MKMEKKNPDKRLPVHIRPARPEDTADVIELTRTIWEGEDYVPRAWPDWLADPEGHLAVAESEQRVIGLVDLTRLSVDEWWLQGLRVDPQFEGRGVARQLHDYIVHYWENNHSGVLRLSTYQPAVRHMCEEGGFAVVGEYSLFKATALEDRPPGGRVPARIPRQFFHEPGERLYARYIDFGWEWAAARTEVVEEAREKLQAWSAVDGKAHILVREDNEDGLPCLELAWLTCPSDRLLTTLLEFRRLGAKQGYQHVYWIAPLEEDVLAALQAASFQRDWDGFVWLFERFAED